MLYTLLWYSFNVPWRICDMIDMVATFNNKYIKQVKQESCLTPSKDDDKMQCILEALQVEIYNSKKVGINN